MTGPLDGIRVADFSRVIAGPVAAMTLADLGADVVKIEHPEGGDDTRGYTPPDFHGFSPAFICFNRNKRSIALDLAVPQGAAVARALIDRADVVIENFSTGVMAKYALDWQTVSAGRGDLIYCSTSAYGRTGPFRQVAGYDPVVQAESGMMSLTGFPDREPVRTAVPMVDVSTGLTAAQAILAALFHRKRSGHGQFIEVPLFDTGFSVTALHATGFLIDGHVPARVGNADFCTAPVGLYTAADRDIMLAVETDVQFRALSDRLDLPQLTDDPRFVDNASRVSHRDALDAVLRPMFETRAAAFWVGCLRDAGVPVGLLRPLPEAYRAAATERSGVIGWSEHSEIGPVPNVRSPLHLSDTPVRAPRAAPRLGADSAEVLGEWLGLGSEALAGLGRSGALGRSCIDA